MAVVAGGVITGVAAARAAARDAVPTVSAPSLASLSVPDLPALTLPLHGEAIVKDPSSGATVIQDFQTGKVTAISSSSMTVRSADGTTWTWTLSADTRAHKGFADLSVSAIKVGDTVAVSGIRSGDTRTAQHVADPPPDPQKLRQDLQKQLPNLQPDAGRSWPTLPALPSQPA
jgi:hypothetical protein